MKRIIFKLLTAIIMIGLILGISVTASAEVPYDSYTYWTEVAQENKAVGNRQMYDADLMITAKSIGVSDFTQVNDICTDKNDKIYILDNSSRIVILNSDYTLSSEIGSINETISYDEAAGLYVERDGTIYICDTQNHRVLHITSTGELIKEIGLPKSTLIPDDFNFLPTAVTSDEQGHLYVVSEGSYYGALLYSPELEFLGFYGANSVKGSLSSVLTNIKNRIMPNNAKKANSVKNLPYCFVDIDIDDAGFIYTCNGYTDRFSKEGQIRRLSPGTGTNVLDSEEINFVDINSNTEYNKGALSKQDIMDLEVDSEGFILGLESAFGKIFLYDSEGRTLSVFGGGMGSGTQVGNFRTVSGMSLTDGGDTVLVCDKFTNSISTFKITDFGKLVKKATNLTINGEYDKAKALWQDILKLDNNYQPAYSGLARASLGENNYPEAMKYAKKGYDRTTYAIAFEYERKDFINDNFTLIFILAIVLVAAVIAVAVIISKKKIVLIKNKEVKLMSSVILHPVNCFTDIKEKQLGSIPLSIITLAIFYVVTILQTLAGGFMFTIYDPDSFNSLWVLVQTVGLVTLWVVADWMVCTLLGGNGKFREIIIITCYSLWPLIISKLLNLVLTNVLIPTEASFLSIIDAIAIIYFVILMVIGLLRIHDFSVTRLIGTTLLAILGIAAIVFLMIMIVILVQQFWGFIVTVASEISTL